MKKKEEENKHFHTLISNRFVLFDNNKQGAYSEPDNVPICAKGQSFEQERQGPQFADFIFKWDKIDR